MRIAHWRLLIAFLVLLRTPTKAEERGTGTATEGQPKEESAEATSGPRFDLSTENTPSKAVGVFDLAARNFAKLLSGRNVWVI